VRSLLPLLRLLMVVLSFCLPTYTVHVHSPVNRPDAEEAMGQLRSFIKDALISDDDVDEIELRYGSLWVAPWITLVGGCLALLALSRPCVDEAVFDVQQNSFWLVRRNSLWLQTHAMRQPLRSVVRLALTDKVVPRRGGTFAKAQTLTVVVQGWEHGGVAAQAAGPAYGPVGSSSGAGGMVREPREHLLPRYVHLNHARAVPSCVTVAFEFGVQRACSFPQFQPPHHSR
jgi:hypothetical protein